MNHSGIDPTTIDDIEMAVCPRCEGGGRIYYNEEGEEVSEDAGTFSEKCENCEGTGEVEEYERYDYDDYLAERADGRRKYGDCA